MKTGSLDLLICPACRSPLALEAARGSPILAGSLQCSRCSRSYPIMDGIPRFIQPEELTGYNRRFSRLYDLFSAFYRLFSRLAFACLGIREETARREILDRLEPAGGRVLEVSIGPGVNLPYLVQRQDVRELYGLDISLGQLTNCQRFLRRRGWNADLFLGNAERLPFADDSFEAVFHIGGINFFNDKKAAIDEMIRVAKPGTRILISDETEKGAREYERFIPGFKRSFTGIRHAVQVPLDLVPPEMQEKHVFEVWKGWFYCLEFRKP